MANAARSAISSCWADRSQAALEKGSPLPDTTITVTVSSGGGITVTPVPDSAALRTCVVSVLSGLKPGPDEPAPVVVSMSKQSKK